MKESKDAVIKNIEASLKNSLSYDAYKELIAELLEKGESTTKGGSEVLVPFFRIEPPPDESLGPAVCDQC